MLGIGGVAAEQTMLASRIGAEDDEVARLRHRRRRGGDGFLEIEALFLLGAVLAEDLGEQVVGLVEVEPGDAEIEVRRLDEFT